MLRFFSFFSLKWGPQSIPALENCHVESAYPKALPQIPTSPYEGPPIISALDDFHVPNTFPNNPPQIPTTDISLLRGLPYSLSKCAKGQMHPPIFCLFCFSKGCVARP
eukprot:TRINITY_DN5844_c0_g2_i1.p1 TRINITY_DN5844_c0_g2~~TRINITY_DN5844_c0_g2_i1.p1  ORF type:complete len:108 (+),score=7.45 TRINITY_DN5844_c0_g2_i1:99-422(+)